MRVQRRAIQVSASLGEKRMTSPRAQNDDRSKMKKSWSLSGLCGPHFQSFDRPPCNDGSSSSAMEEVRKHRGAQSSHRCRREAAAHHDACNAHPGTLSCPLDAFDVTAGTPCSLAAAAAEHPQHEQSLAACQHSVMFCSGQLTETGTRLKKPIFVSVILALSSLVHAHIAKWCWSCCERCELCSAA